MIIENIKREDEVAYFKMSKIENPEDPDLKLSLVTDCEGCSQREPLVQKISKDGLNFTTKKLSEWRALGYEVGFVASIVKLDGQEEKIEFKPQVIFVQGGTITFELR